MDETFYHDRYKYDYRKGLNSAIAKQTISQRDKSLIVEYITEKQVQDHIGSARINKIVSILINFRRFLPVEYEAADVGEVYEAIKNLMNGASARGRPFKQNTLHSYIVILKPFLIWLVHEGRSTLPVKKIKAISPPSQDQNITRPDEIHTVEEIERMIDACKNPRDKALIAVLYESGMRIGELAALTWRQLIFDENGVRCYIDDKKSKRQRYTRLTMSHEYLARWHKYTHDHSPDARVFVNVQDKSPLKYITIRRLLDRVQRGAGITKPVRPHLFRKDRITHMIAQNYQESVIKKAMWGNLNTEMFQTYVCLAEMDIDNEFLTKAGLQRVEKTGGELRPVPCIVCGYVNEPKADYCSRCGSTLSEEAAASLQRMRDSVLMNPALLKQILYGSQGSSTGGPIQRDGSETVLPPTRQTLPGRND